MQQWKVEFLHPVSKEWRDAARITAPAGSAGIYRSKSEAEGWAKTLRATHGKTQIRVVAI